MNKRKTRYTMIRTVLKPILTLLLMLCLGFGAMGQPPPPSQHGQESNQGRGAPIGDGWIILLVLGAAYGAKKIYDARKHYRLKEE